MHNTYIITVHDFNHGVTSHCKVQLWGFSSTAGLLHKCVCKCKLLLLDYTCTACGGVIDYGIRNVIRECGRTLYVGMAQGVSFSLYIYTFTKTYGEEPNIMKTMSSNANKHYANEKYTQFNINPNVTQSKLIMREVVLNECISK